ncbi:bifunctional heptose 7-phosphate kinase/heptose 1-phosphate adenyltransferase [Syntrophorhabdus aromaticivorans]|uniref:Carbohydrate kinase n=1 Tax=Syntrophorhabdus aromaticivorans TaxID=328301 RepID=A0A971M2U2_9BACT|nr:bifunctional ADP-heptose synthase [Syntrophorhabdus aromaticivorans]NLW34312.1 carbohydrate kinase [Syntrophorhabdus aromaticivorans]
MNAGLRKLTEGFKGKKICVVGDIIADIYIFGRPYRLSREAPVVVVKHEEERVYPGSAGNTINNLLALGAHVFPLGFVGNDNAGDRIIDYFSRYTTIDMGGLIRHDGETVTKTRILAGDTHTSKQQVIRIDRESDKPLAGSVRSLLLGRLKEIGPSMDAFVVSDYGHGAVDEEIIGYMRGMARNAIVVGDSRYRLKDFKELTLITPNEAEAYQLCGMDGGDDIEKLGRDIMGFMGVAALLITRGNKGMTLFLRDGTIHHIPISGKDDVADVTGAGDTVCAVAALSLASGADFYAASRVANYAAGVVVMKRGTATVTMEELQSAMETYGKNHTHTG